MNIAIFTESYRPTVNGVSTSIGSLENALRAQGHRIFVFAPAFPDAPRREAHLFRFPSWISPFERNYPLAIPFAKGFSACFDSLGIDIVHTHSPFTLGGAGQRAALKRNLPVVSTIHTLYHSYTHYVPFVPAPLSRWFITRWVSRYYRRCDALIAPSTPVARLWRQFGVSTPIEVIPTGIPPIPARSRAESRVRFAIPESARVLIYVGRLAQEKNLDLLLEAFASVVARFPESCLLLVGSGPSAEQYKARANSMGLKDCIRFAGFMPREEVGFAYAASDLFVFPSDTDTQALVICEAMAAGLPSVAVDAFGPSEVVRNGVTGFLAPKNVAVFTDKIIEILDSPALHRRMSQAACLEAARYTPEAYAARVMALYQSALRARRSGEPLTLPEQEPRMSAPNEKC
ncbi:MAG: glycosyltransferase family 4 protein [Armatimonadetes bacterium]|nr:glycosyltransferase family 4 protein [Armatimonadota bacterium]